ncbi:MAG: T9SS type A sorting domain-containing protein [Crocinitomicaceae bacterium]
MKKSLLFGLSLLLGSYSFSQDISLMYAPLEETDYMVIRDVVETSDNHLLVGFDHHNALDVPAAGIMKTAFDGTVVWAKTLEIAGSVAGCTFEVVEKENGNYLLWGLSKEAETNHMRAILTELDENGAELWSKEYDFGTNETVAYTINKLRINNDGTLQMMIAVFSKVIVMQTTETGDIIWAKQTGIGAPDEGGKNPGFEWLAIPEPDGDDDDDEEDDGGGACAGKATNDFSLLRYTADGELLWNRAYSIGGYTHGKTLARSPNGNILVAGFVDYVPHIMEVDVADGSLIWVKTFPGTTLGFLGKAHLSVVDDEIIFDMANPAGRQYFIKLTEDGEVIEATQSVYDVIDYNKLEYAEEKNVYLYGSGEFTPGAYDAMIHRVANVFDESCLIQPSDIAFTTADFTDTAEVDFTPVEVDFTNQEDIEISAIDFHVRGKFACDIFLGEEDANEGLSLSVYPNPTTNEINIQVNGEINGSATYELYDIAGKVILNGTLNSAFEMIDLQDLDRGQYILHVAVDSKRTVEKITLQ